MQVQVDATTWAINLCKCASLVNAHSVEGVVHVVVEISEGC